MSVSPRQSVEGVFDEATDAEVRRRWAVLADAGLPSQASHRGQSNSPHLTLSVAECVPADVEQGLVDLAGDPGAGLPLACRLGPLVLLGGRRLVVAHLVVPSEPLLRLQAAVAALMAGGEGVSDLVLPGRWTPHVTLARGVDRGRLGGVLDALGRLDELEGAITSLRRWNPVERRVWALGADSDLPTMGA
ncbi:MAG: 2'-5' RNA ligase family protein [Humibacillus sp.]|nr:2'-5' RNA ligase family protein [Humibacillus sp.]MDN5777328.1 2'-5' RNA ligase family protein [Humibacillus sp.]